MLRTPHETQRNYREARVWWSTTLQGLTAGTVPPRQAMLEAARRFEEIMRAHARSSNIAGTLYQRVAVLATAAGLAEDVGALSGGYGKMKDTEVLEDLWRTAKGELTLDVFLARHGYHGPDEGEVSSKS